MYYIYIYLIYSSSDFTPSSSSCQPLPHKSWVANYWGDSVKHISQTWMDINPNAQCMDMCGMFTFTSAQQEDTHRKYTSPRDDIG